MSNWLAIATVSGVLEARLRSHLEAVGLGFNVTVSHPLDVGDAGVYLHLFSVLPNPGLRNESLPERAGDGTVRVSPRLVLDLNYQISFVGSAASYDPERMAGAVMTGLNEFPRIAPQEISDFLAAQGPGSVLAASDLADQIEQVRLTPMSADVEELSRLWAMTQRSFHRLSVLYRASAVILEPDTPAVSPLPVVEPRVTVFQLRQPRITSVVSSARDLAVVEFGERMLVRGSALRGDVTEVVLSDQRRPPDAAAAEELGLDFDAASGLRAGVYPVQVRHRIILENGDTRDGASSNTFPAALAPRITPRAVPDGGPLTSELGPPAAHVVHLVPEPAPFDDQRVELSLTPLGPTPARSSIDWAAEDGGAGLAVTFVPPIDSGSYLLRLSIDGAESLLVADGSGVFVDPNLVVP